MKNVIIFSVVLAFSLCGITPAACPIADLTDDCVVNFDDFIIFADWWLSDCNSMNDYCSWADYDFSGQVDPNDLEALTADWINNADAFITTWDTSLATGTTVTLALAGTVNATIDWGDGSPAEHVTTPGPHVHDYGIDAIYTVFVTGSIQAYNSLDNGTRYPHAEEAKLIRVDHWGQVGFTSMTKAFYNCRNLVSVPATTRGLEDVTDMSSMFGCSYIGWSSFNADISKWDTANITNMSYMFFNTPFNQDISGWDTANVTDMSGMFRLAAAFNQNIGNWDTARVTTMKAMFWDAASFNQDIGDWDTAAVTDMAVMFDGATSFNQDIGRWDTANVTDMIRLFRNAASFNANIGRWNTANVVNMHYMFDGAAAFNQNLSGWCVELIPVKPGDFDTDAASWTLPRPVWGTCP